MAVFVSIGIAAMPGEQRQEIWLRARAKLPNPETYRGHARTECVTYGDEMILIEKRADEHVELILVGDDHRRLYPL